MEPINTTTSQPASSIHKGYLYCFKTGILRLAINIMASANGSINPLINPAKSNNSFGLPIQINKEVDIKINPLIENRS
jgi:hypothetical protein